MAAKNKTKTPAVRYLRYELTNSNSPDTETSHFIDLAKGLSMVNRRLYRQGRDYHVKKITVVSSNTPNLGNRVSVATIPSGWPQHMAWKRGFQVWRDMYKNASQNISGDIEGTWSDFKVYLSNDMRSASVTNPLDNGGNAYLVDEWAYSQYVSPDGTTAEDSFTIHMLGDHSGSAGAWNSVGLVKSYGESRATVQAGSPAVPGEASDDPLVNVFDYGTEIDEVIDLMEGSNDLPPYDQASYPGDDANGPKPLIVQDTTLVDGRTVMSGFTALCGLMEFEIKSAIPSDVFSVLVELSPGNYRGIAAEAI